MHVSRNETARRESSRSLLTSSLPSSSSSPSTNPLVPVLLKSSDSTPPSLLRYQGFPSPTYAFALTLSPVLGHRRVLLAQ